MELSIILEWENTLLAEDERCWVMLRNLGKQLQEVNRPAEVIVLFNPEQVSQVDIEKALTDFLREEITNSSVDIQLRACPGKHYYALKNEGAKHANGELIIFIDSDVVQEDNWLSEITQPFYQYPEIGVLAGHTYLTCDTLVGKAFALGWFFPLRRDEDILYSTKKRFHANNVAFRREVILRYPFPAMQQGVTRGACKTLADNLLSSGYLIWTNTAARCSHPPPSSCMQHYLVRALAQGRDHALSNSDPAQGRLPAIRRSFSRGREKIGRCWRNIRNKRRRVGLSYWQAPAAFSVMFCYYTLDVIGGCTAILFPDFAREHWRL